MYFKNREEAGKLLAAKLQKFKKVNTSIIALTPGAVLIGEQIAKQLHASLMMLLTENITIPGENDAIGAISGSNIFTYNSMYSVGEIEEFNEDYWSYIEQERIGKLHELHLLESESEEKQRNSLKHHSIIVLSDGLNSGFSLEICNDFIKSVAIERLVMAAPFATPEAFDKMHLLSDEVVCLNIVESFMGVDHYYDSNEIPPIPELLKITQNISLNWQH